MDRLYRLLEAAGYPSDAIDWLRRHRLAVILVMAVASWIPVAVLVYALSILL
jgi:hypothetical protein